MSGSVNLESGSPRASRRMRVLRPWRWALLIYGIGLTIATHWPRLQLSPEIPASDKTIHLLAFAALTLLLWRSDVLGPRWLVAIIALAWSALDEISQAIPILQRTVSWHDLIANVCGVACAMALIWALRPLRDTEQLAGPNEHRARLFQFTFDAMFARPRPWLIGATMVVVCTLAILIARPLLPSPRAVGLFALGLAIVALHALYLIYRRIFFREFEFVRSERRCFACGASHGSVAPPGDGDLVCGTCGASTPPAAYALPPRPSTATVLRISIIPALAAVAGIAAIFALVLLVPYVYAVSITTPTGRTTAPRLAQAFGRLPASLTSVVDFTMYALLIAVVVRIWRRRYASYVDRAVRCRQCGHDLHGTPVNERGEGQCGECGADFTRDLLDGGASVRGAA